jgi:oligopeptide transport system permease protein
MNNIADIQAEDPFAAAMIEDDIRGRSLWVDAWHRLLKNRAAVISGIIMATMILLVVVGPALSPWEGDFTDWDNTSSPPSLETGHWFGTDSVGRDILVRTLEGGRISLLVGLVATLVSLAIGVSYGAVAGYYGGFTDRDFRGDWRSQLAGHGENRARANTGPEEHRVRGSCTGLRR